MKVRELRLTWIGVAGRRDSCALISLGSLCFLDRRALQDRSCSVRKGGQERGGQRLPGTGFWRCSGCPALVHRELAEHLAEEVVQIAPVRDRGEVVPVGLSGSVQVHAVERRVVEEVPFTAPHLVEHLLPLRSGIDKHLLLSGDQVGW